MKNYNKYNRLEYEFDQFNERHKMIEFRLNAILGTLEEIGISAVKCDDSMPCPLNWLVFKVAHKGTREAYQDHLEFAIDAMRRGFFAF